LFHVKQTILPSQTKTATLWACRFLMMISAMHIIYLHGFNSGPQSLKAQETGAGCSSTHRTSAALPATVAPPGASHCPGRSTLAVPACRHRLDRQFARGYYATALAEKHGRKAALINPAVQPDQDLLRYLGRQHNPIPGKNTCWR
jgi:hypothetical protein